MNTKICIGIPTNRQFHPQTVLSLANLIAHSKLDYFITIPTEGYNCAENRNFIVAKAIKEGCTHIFFSDDDMIYAPDTLEKLLADDKDIVGGFYNARHLPTALIIGYQGEMTDEEAKGRKELFECNALGGGALLVKTEVFKKITSPFFGYKWHDNGMVEMSNDWYFCEKAKEAGYKVWANPLLELKHCGTYEF